MATLYNHNFGNCTATWNGIDVKASLDQGSPIVVARTVPEFTIKATGSGNIIRVRATDNSGMITTTIDYSSPAYVLLQAARVLEQTAVFTLYDGNTGRKWYHQSAFIVTDPDLTLGVDTTPFTFTWFFVSRDFQAGAQSNLNLNVVGG
jgi:hypothetical protein